MTRHDLKDIPDELFEARLRTGVPLVRAAACRAWSVLRCSCDLDALVDAGAEILVKAATQAANDAEFLDRLVTDLPEAMRRAANDASHEEKAS